MSWDYGLGEGSIHTRQCKNDTTLNTTAGYSEVQRVRGNGMNRILVQRTKKYEFHA